MDDALTFKDVDRILAWIDATPELTEFSLKFGDLDLSLSRGEGGALRSVPGGPVAMPPAAAGHGPGQAAGAGMPTGAAGAEGAAGAGAGAASPAASGADSGAAGLQAAAGIPVKSPMVGTFYRAPEPGAPPFVEVGQRVEADTTVCIIEVMKLMNSIPAGTAGIVRSIMVPDSGAVEYGQVLMVIEPDG